MAAATHHLLLFDSILWLMSKTLVGSFNCVSADLNSLTFMGGSPYEEPKKLADFCLNNNALFS